MYRSDQSAVGGVSFLYKLTAMSCMPECSSVQCKFVAALTNCEERHNKITLLLDGS